MLACKPPKPTTRARNTSCRERTIAGEQSPSEAAQWYRRAAEQGDAEAQLLLGSFCASGSGVPADGVLAHMWISLSADSGIRRSIRLLRTLESKLSRNQINQAERFKTRWIEAHRLDEGASS